MSPLDAFIISRIEGTSSVAEIAEAVGRPLEEVSGVLRRLADVGALAFSDPPGASSRRAHPAPNPSGPFRVGPVVEARRRQPTHPAAALYDPAELEEPVEIDQAVRRQILDLYYRLEQLNHYELFGVAPNAEKKAIKAAYFEVVRVFHPDRYFGKQVGSFKLKLERVFARLSESYEVLNSNERRAAYDEYLRAQTRTRAFTSGESPALQARIAEIERQIQAEASSEQRASSREAAPSPPPPTGPYEPTPSQRAPLGAGPLSHAALRASDHIPSDPESRRRALARKLGRSLTPMPSAAPPASLPGPDPDRHARAAEELKRRYSERLLLARTRQVDGYVRTADESLRRGDVIGASNALRIATSLAPSDLALAERLREVAAKASEELYSSYLKQADYEERSERYLAATRSYEKAAQVRPEAATFERIAHCLLAGDGELRAAGENAKRAVLLAPESAKNRVTLARFYIKAQMRQSAEGELSRAATLAPKDDTITDSIQKLRRDLA